MKTDLSQAVSDGGDEGPECLIEHAVASSGHSGNNSRGRGPGYNKYSYNGY